MFKLKQNPIVKIDIRSKFRNSFKSKGTISVILVLVMLIFRLAIFQNFKRTNYELKATTKKEWLNKFYQDGNLVNLMKIDRTGAQAHKIYCLFKRRSNKDGSNNTDIASDKIPPNKMNYFY